MTEINASKGMWPKGFSKWKKIATDDLPPIRPPRRHMLAQLTGGLKQLYQDVKKGETKRHRPLSSLSRTTGSPSPPILSPGVISNTCTKRDSIVFSKRDDEGGGSIKYSNIENEESSPFTDQDGVFCPDSTIPLLASRYKFVEILARGQSAIIVKALDTFNSDKSIAIKVLHKVYQPIGSQEADILLELHQADPWLHVPFARLQNQFIYGPHYCLVFEYLSPTPLYIHYGEHSIKGPASINNIRMLCLKLLSVIGFLHKQNVIHADLKPENILLRDEQDMGSIVVVDFGNALRNTEEELALYYSDYELQTLLYRAPEVIFGLRFSLPIDLWSLGCLLAECYSGQPLFLGKTKLEILAKITKLLGPFPKNFMEGECAKNFKQFIGQPFSCQQRVENLRKRLDCKDINFLLLLNSFLIYEPEQRITPFEASSHSFLAGIHPFLYMTSSGNARYPKILIPDIAYCNFPRQDKYSESAQALLKHSAVRSPPIEPAGKSGFSEFMKQVPLITQVSSSVNPISSPDHERAKIPEQSKSESPMNSPESTTSHLADSDKTKEVGDQPSSDASFTIPTINPLKAKDLLLKDCKQGEPTRTDFKQTLKSMGLKCEDFTISVYSTEQAHAILRRQGVEVTNHGSKPKAPTEKPVASKPSVSIAKADSNKADTEDDDDCIILEPPEGTKAPPPPPKKYPHKYQLLGTTVLVNRSGKRPHTDINPISAKRLKGPKENIKPETSVEDTLKRLKNYNISITCRKNANDSSDLPVNKSIAPPENGDADLARFLECQLEEEALPINTSTESDRAKSPPRSPAKNGETSPSKKTPEKDLSGSDKPPVDTSVPQEPDSSKSRELPSETQTNDENVHRASTPNEQNDTNETDFLERMLKSVEQSSAKTFVSPVSPPRHDSVFSEEEPELEDPQNRQLIADEEINDELEQELLKMGNIDEKYKNEDLPDECVGI